jgi:predicted alpha-1,6-mannanase (GH76 family)
VVRFGRLCRSWKRSFSKKNALAGLVSAALATALALALTGLASSHAPAASRLASVAVRARAKGCVPEPANAKASVPAPLKADLATLVGQYFLGNQGTFADTFWRQAVAMSAMEAYRQTTGDPTYDDTFDNTELFNPPVNFFEDALNDDTAWWGLALLQGYSITCDPNWLQDAEDIANYIGKTWNTDPMACFSGGIPWERSGPNFGYTGAIQNGLFLELTAWLHNTIVKYGGKDSTYLNWAKREWKYLTATGDFHTNPIPVPPGFGGPPVLEPYWVPNATPDLPSVAPDDALCGGARYRIFTYNQGVLIAGLVQLYKATNTLGYLRDAEDIATAVLKTPTPAEVATAVTAFHTGASPWIFTDPFSGVLIEPQDPAFSPTCCLGDGAAFKGIFIRDLRMLDDTIASPSTPKDANSGPECTASYANNSYNQCVTMYNQFFIRQACSIEAHDTVHVTGFSINPNGVSIQGQNSYLGDHWTGPDEPDNTTTQVGGVEALVAADKLPDHGPPFPDCRSARGSSGHDRQQTRPDQDLQDAWSCYGGWYWIPACSEERGFGRYPAPWWHGQFYYARRQPFIRAGYFDLLT